MLKPKFVSIVLLLLQSILVNSALADDAKSINTHLDKAISEAALSGIVWSTVTNTEIAIGSAGHANVEKNGLMQPSSKVHVGSVTKTVLALGVLRMVSEGKLSLNTNVAALLPQIKLNNPWQDIAPVTVKHLLDHTAGLDNIRMWQFLSSQPTPDSPLASAFPVNNNQLLNIRTKPGSQYSYSNMGYTLLGMVIEAVTKQRYEDYLDKHLLAPLAMFDSTFAYVSQTGGYADALLAMGYFENNVAQTAVPMYLRPAGQFTTTAADMAKFMQFILGDGRLNGVEFVDADLMQMLSYPDQTDAEKAGLNIGHGLALAVRDRHGVIGMCHPGTTIGFRAYLCIYPEEKKAFFYAINTDSETADYEQFNQYFIEQLTIKKANTIVTTTKDINVQALAGAYYPAPNNMAEFEWLDLLFNFKWLTSNDHGLMVHSLQQDKRQLLAISEQLFRATDRTQISHVFYRGDNNDWYFSNGLSTYKKQSITIAIAYWLILVAGLIGLAYIVIIGTYRVLLGKIKHSKTLLWPLLNIFALSVPGYLISQQSFLKFGDPTLASMLLAAVTGLLPLTLLYSLYALYRKSPLSNQDKRDLTAYMMALQLWLILVVWQQLPVIFWQ